jgi:hypothetical protein
MLLTRMGHSSLVIGLSKGRRTNDLTNTLTNGKTQNLPFTLMKSLHLEKLDPNQKTNWLLTEIN